VLWAARASLLCKLGRERGKVVEESKHQTHHARLHRRSRFNGAVSAEDHGSTPERYAGSPTPLREQLTLRAPRLERDSVCCGSDAREEAPGMRSTTATTPATTQQASGVAPQTPASPPRDRGKAMLYTNLSFFKIILTSKCIQR
jgi:hypothetical protein